MKTTPGPEPIDPLSLKYDRLFREGNLLFVLLSFFGFGLLLSLTPCVFPMIPILSGIIVAQGTCVPKGRSFTLSLIYVLGMALTFAAVGVIAGLTGFLISDPAAESLGHRFFFFNLCPPGPVHVRLL